MMRLRLVISAIDLADRLQFCKITAADTFLDIIGILYVKVSLLIIWPERPKLQLSMPMCAKNKFRCKIISHNSDKYVVRITRQVTTCFISKSWSLRERGKHIIENSEILEYVVYTMIL